MRRDSIPHTLAVTVVLAVGCSLLVSAAAIGLRDLQERNKALYKKTNILTAAGLYRRGMDVVEEFDRRVEARLVDLNTGTFAAADEIDPLQYDQVSAARDPEMSEVLPAENDLAGILRRETFSFVYLIEEGGKIDQVVLPFRGKGLFSTLYGYLAVDSDRSTIRGITFYEHGETPGLGGEVDNMKWKEKWVGQKLYDEAGEVALELTKVPVPAGDPKAGYAVDGLSGATMTSMGVTEMIRFWLGPDGFGPFLQDAEISG